MDVLAIDNNQLKLNILNEKIHHWVELLITGDDFNVDILGDYYG